MVLELFAIICNNWYFLILELWKEIPKILLNIIFVMSSIWILWSFKKLKYYCQIIAWFLINFSVVYLKIYLFYWKKMRNTKDFE